jgi:hypothetical protein
MKLHIENSSKSLQKISIKQLKINYFYSYEVPKSAYLKIEIKNTHKRFFSILPHK